MPYRWRTRLGTGAVAIAAMLGATGCSGIFSGGTASVRSSATVPIGGRPAANFGSESVAGLSRATVGLFDGHYAPTVLVGTPGQELSVLLENRGTRRHAFTIPSQDVDVVLDRDDHARARVKFPESGILAFYDGLDRGSRMRGGLRAGDGG